MKILLLNWRDVKNPNSGGAEILTHEIATRLVKKGHSVTWFASEFPGCKKQEVIDKITVIRQGSPDFRSLFNSTHFKAYKFYKEKMQGNIDVVIDEIHGLPFFTPFYVKEKKIVLICEVAKDIWDKMFPFPWNIVGKIVERIYFAFYKKVNFLTISDSTKKDLISYGILSRKITVLPMGINRVNIQKTKKEKDLTIIFVGRINKMKGVSDAVEAIAVASQKIPSIKLWIVGGGDKDYVAYLKNLIHQKGIQKNIIWWGYVAQRKKFELMAKAWCIVVPSTREGFGLIVPEAGSVETPAVVYDVPGLRDIVKKNVNGIIVPKEDINGLAKAFVSFFQNKKQYEKMKSLAKKEANSYNWDDTARETLEVLTSK